MAASSSLSFRPFFSSVTTDSKHVGFTPGNFVPSFVDFRVSIGLAKALKPRGKSLLAQLDKADGAFCFTSGMAALAAVAHLVGTHVIFNYTTI